MQFRIAFEFLQWNHLEFPSSSIILNKLIYWQSQNKRGNLKKQFDSRNSCIHSVLNKLAGSRNNINYYTKRRHVVSMLHERFLVFDEQSDSRASGFYASSRSIDSLNTTLNKDSRLGFFALITAKRISSLLT
jgi:hypothetical protein